MGRRYRMVVRAEATADTRARILDATAEIFMGQDLGEVTLDAVARRAGVTLQTVLRHFGSKDGLVDAAITAKSAEVFAAREPAAGGGAPEAVRALVASYEEMGDRNWRLLCHEERAAVRRLLVTARRLHRDWIARQFAALLPASGSERDRRLDALFTATD